jgi:hypothetical protein
MLRSRVTTTPDLGRLANAVARPGIDPRVWVSYAILTSDPVIEMRDGQQDVFVDLLLLPTQEASTARVGVAYAGNGFGFYTPLHKDDEVLVVAPSGNPDEGLVVTQRLWSPADPPPEALTTYPTDVLLVVETDKSLRINVAGGGKVYLGDVEATRGAARLDDTTANGTLALVVATNVPAPGLNTGTLTYTAPGGLPQSVGEFVIPGAITAGSATISGKIDSASEKVLVEG